MGLTEDRVLVGALVGAHAARHLPSSIVVDAKSVWCWLCGFREARLRGSEYHCQRSRGGCGLRWPPTPCADIPSSEPCRTGPGFIVDGHLVFPVEGGFWSQASGFMPWTPGAAA